MVVAFMVGQSFQIQFPHVLFYLLGHIESVYPNYHGNEGTDAAVSILLPHSQQLLGRRRLCLHVLKY